MKKRVFPKLTPSALVPLCIACYLFFSMLSISMSQIFLGISFFLWLFLLIKKKRSFLVPPFFWALVAYSLLSLGASFFSVNPEISLIDCRELLLFLVVPIAFTAFTKEEELKNTNLALLASAFLSLFFSFFYYLFKASPGERIAGFMGHYMTQAGLLMLFSAMALALFFFSREKIRYIWGIGFLLSLAALMLTLTRSAWIGVVVASCVILLLSKPRALIAIPVVIGLFFLLSPHHMKRRALSIFSPKSYSNFQRVEYVKAGIQIIKENPIWGTGPDTVDMVFQHPKYGLSEEARHNVHLHNNIIQTGAERGLPALGAWLIFFAWAFWGLVKLLRTKNSSLYALAVAALAALSGLMAAGLFEYNFGDSEIATLFLYLITVPFALERIQKSPVPNRKDLAE